MESNSIGMSLNIRKCELISTRVNPALTLLSSFTHHFPNEANILDAPLLPGSALDSALGTQCDNLTRAVSRLKLISSHGALIILRNCLSAPKLNYTLRAAPVAGHLSLVGFAEILRKAVCSIVNENLSDVQWLQASLPVGIG